MPAAIDRPDTMSSATAASPVARSEEPSQAHRLVGVASSGVTRPRFSSARNRVVAWAVKIPTRKDIPTAMRLR
ncbi:hypothetical protein GCM10020001_111330 [Nonomuraea salmonea]